MSRLRGGGSTRDSSSPAVAGSDGCSSSRLSQAVSGLSGMSGRRPAGIAMNNARLVKMRETVLKFNDDIARMLLSSKELVEKRSTIESAFRICTETVIELTIYVASLLEERAESGCADLVRRTVLEALEADRKRSAISGDRGDGGASSNNGPTWSSVVNSPPHGIYMPRGPAVDVPVSTSFLVVPSSDSARSFASSQATKDMLQRVLKPADCGLKINSVRLARNNGLRIDASSPDIDRIKSHPAIIEAGLTVVENIKLNPRIIVHGIPADMSASEIQEEFKVQNLDGVSDSETRMVYIFPRKSGRDYTSCIIEVSPSERKLLLRNDRVFLRFSACRFSDHIRVLQCFKCLSFGHVAKDCVSEQICCHCAESHAHSDCTKKSMEPKCANCIRDKRASYDHTAFDTNKCPALIRCIKSKIALINYG